MTTYPAIQPRPILSKIPTNNLQQSSPIYLIQPSTIPNSDLIQNNSSQISTPLTPYEEFLKRLREFHRSRQTSFRFLPTIAGQIIDLHFLYTTVVNSGGWDKVNDRQLWPTIANHFDIDSTCLNGTQALKNIYIRYLYAFEKINNGETLDLHDDENDDAKKRTVSQLQRVPQSYNHAQHNVSDALRNQYGLFNDFVRRNEFEKLELALICGFPNELTFTLNTLLLLSSSSSHSKSFNLYKCPRLLDLLFRHIGLFIPSDRFINHNQSYQILYDDIWTKHIDYHLHSFWIESCSSKILKLLLNISNNEKIDQYFNLNSTINYQQQQFRIEQILMIIRNLSFDRANALYLLENIQLNSSITYIFLLLISYCEKNIELQKYVYDIWTNLASYMHLRTISNDEGLLFRQLLNHMLNGDNDDEQQQQDRFKIIRALEIISNLAHAGSDNGIYLMDYIPIMITNLIHLPDILILVHTLEALYQLSELGEQLCDAILKVQLSPSIIPTLIDLLTIEARSFSSQAIKTIKIVEMSTGPVLLPTYHQPQKMSQPVMVISTNPQQQQQHLPHQTYPIENPDMNKNLTRILIQQNSRTLTGNIVSIQNPNPQILDNNKRKHDSISDTITAVVNGTPPPLKRIRPSKPAIIPSSSNEDETSINSVITDLLNRCSSPSFDDDIRSCLNDLCQRVVLIVDQSLTDLYHQIPSPIFTRKMDLESSKDDEQSLKKKRNQLTNKKSSLDNPSTKEDIIEQELTDIKPTISSSNVITTSTSDYICDWNDCRACFSTARGVFHHVCSVHIKHSLDYVCLWNGCDRIKRQKWALISHVQERHCSEAAFRQAKLKLTNPNLSTTVNTISIPSNISTPPINRSLPSGTVGYAPDAAWLAIRRHLQINLFDDQIIKSKEGPLTKSIRLTSALILRNIARYSSIGKQNLRQYEQILANLALESSEASHTLSSCLFELYN